MKLAPKEKGLGSSRKTVPVIDKRPQLNRHEEREAAR